MCENDDLCFFSCIDANIQVETKSCIYRMHHCQTNGHHALHDTIVKTVRYRWRHYEMCAGHMTVSPPVAVPMGELRRTLSQSRYASFSPSQATRWEDRQLS